MIIEVTSRTKKCTDCGIVLHNSLMNQHSCTPVQEEVKEVKKTTKKAKK